MFLIHTRVGKCSSPFSSGCFMVCFYINSLIYLEFVSVFGENRDLAFLFSEQPSTSFLPFAQSFTLAHWFKFCFEFIFNSCCISRTPLTQPDPSLSVALECRHWPFNESIPVFLNFIDTMQTETTCLLCYSKSVHKYPQVLGFFSSRFLSYVIFSWFHVSKSQVCNKGTNTILTFASNFEEF